MNKPKNQTNIQGKSKGRVENLKPQKAGEPSHNPNGRPKGVRNRSTIVREWLEANYKKVNPITGQTETLQIQDHIVISLIGKALKGDVPAFKELMDSGHGKIIDGLDVTSKGESITSGEKLSPEERRMLIDKLRVDMGTNNG
jgi:hypothetical protein